MMLRMVEEVKGSSDVQPSLSISFGDRVKTALFGGLGTAAGFAFYYAYFGTHGYRTWHGEKAWKFIIIIGMSVIISTLIHLAEKRKEEVEKHEAGPKVTGSKKWLPLILVALVSAFGITIDELHKHTLVLHEEELNIVIPFWISFFFLGAFITFFWSLGAWKTPKRASKMGFIGGLIAGMVYALACLSILPKDLPFLKSAIFFIPIAWGLIGWYGGRIIDRPRQLRVGAHFMLRFFILFPILFVLTGLFYTLIGWGFLWGPYILRAYLLITAGWAIGLIAYPMSDVVLGYEESKFKRKYTPIIVTACLIISAVLIDRLCIWGDRQYVQSIQTWDPKRLDTLEERILLMVMQGVDLNAKNKAGKTALQVADKRGFLVTIVYLRELGADVNDKEGKRILDSALVESARIKNLVLVEHLLRGNEKSPPANINATDKYGNTALMIACSNNDVPMAKYLIAKKADLNIKNDYQVDAMMVAMNVHNGELFRELLGAGAKSDSYQLLAAAIAGDLEKVDILLQNKANVNEKNTVGTTALMFAIAEGKEKVAQRLLREKGIEVDTKDQEGRTALMFAAMAGNSEMVKMLLKAGASPAAVDKVGWSSLGFAALNGKVDAAAKLIDAGSDLSWINSDHVSILMAAAFGGNGELVRFLVNQGLDVNAIDRDRRTALILAAQNGRKEVVKILLEAKADISAVDKQNHTAADYACANQHQEICDLLRTPANTDSEQPPN